MDFQPYSLGAAAWERLRRADHEPVARDLVEIAGVTGGHRVLDVGTGTGFVARAASDLGACVFGLDPSLAMLEQVPDPRVLRVGGSAPGLPFPPCTFDVVVGNLVLSHFADAEAGLADLTTVLHRGGVLALTAWGPSSAYGRSPVDDIGDVWWEVASPHLAPEDAEAAIRAVIPWEDHFSDPDNLAGAFRGAGLSDVTIREERYPLELSAAEAMNFLSTGMRWQYAHQVLGDAVWSELLAETTRRAAARFPGRFHHTRPMMLAAGRKPA